MNKNDEKIKQLLKLIDEKKEALGQKPNGILLTNGIFKYSEKDIVNINTVSDKIEIILMGAHILKHQEFFNQSCNKLNNPIEFQYDGYSVEDWFADFSLRLSKLEWNEKSLELTQLEKKLRTLMSETVKTELELEDIVKKLN